MLGHKKIGTFKLEDEEYVFNQGDPLYETRFVLSRKRDGTYKARMVLRVDFQVFDDPGDYDVTNEWSSDEAKRDSDWAEAYVLSPKKRAKRYAKVCDDADDESHADDAVEMNFDGIFDVSEKVKIVDADDFSDSSSVDDDGETMTDVDLLTEIGMPEFRA